MPDKSNAVTVFDKAADRYADKYMDVRAYRSALDRFCQLLPDTHGRVLDLACGPGNLLRYVAERCPRAVLYGIDLAPAMIAIARQQLPKATFSVSDIRSLKAYPVSDFTGLLCGFALPYLTAAAVTRFCADLAALLQPGGVLYLSTLVRAGVTDAWQVSSESDLPPLKTYYHPLPWLSTRLTNNQFTVLDTYDFSPVHLDPGEHREVGLLLQKQ